MTDVVFVDVETTGLDAQNDSVIQIGAVRTDATGSKVKASLSVKVRPTTPVHSKAAEVNGYTPEGWADAVEPQVAAEQLAAIAQGAEFAAHCVWFDHGFVERLLVNNGVRVPWGRRLIDTQTLAHLLRADKADMRGTSLQECIRVLGGTRGPIHDALEDATWAKEVYAWAMARVAPVSEAK